jgi:hypothetical protein
LSDLCSLFNNDETEANQIYITDTGFSSWPFCTDFEELPALGKNKKNLIFQKYFTIND